MLWASPGKQDFIFLNQMLPTKCSDMQVLLEKEKNGVSTPRIRYPNIVSRLKHYQDTDGTTFVTFKMSRGPMCRQ